MSGADARFHQYRKSAANTPAHSKPSSRVASPTSSKPTSRTASKPASRRGSQSEDAKKLAKALARNEWKTPGLYSDSRPSSRSNSRKNSFSEKTEKLKHQLKSSGIDHHVHFPNTDETAVDAEAIKKALSTMEWKSTGVYSNPSSAANSRRNSLTGKFESNKKLTNGHVNGTKNDDAAKLSKAISTNEWKAPGLYSNSKPSSRCGSRKNSISDKTTQKLKKMIQSEIHNDNLDPELIKIALSKMEWKSPGVYSSANSAANSRRNSLTRQTGQGGKILDSHANNVFDVNEMEKALNTCEWRATGVYSSKSASAANSRRNSITENHNGRITRGTEKHVISGEINGKEVSKESVEKALTSCEWRASGVYSSKPSSRATSRKNSIDNSKKTSAKTKKANLSKQGSKDPITEFFRATSRPTSRRGSIIDEGSQIPTFPIMSFIK